MKITASSQAPPPTSQFNMAGAAVALSKEQKPRHQEEQHFSKERTPVNHPSQTARTQQQKVVQKEEITTVNELVSDAARPKSAQKINMRMLSPIEVQDMGTARGYSGMPATTRAIASATTTTAATIAPPNKSTLASMLASGKIDSQNYNYKRGRPQTTTAVNTQSVKNLNIPQNFDSSAKEAQPQQQQTAPVCDGSFD